MIKYANREPKLEKITFFEELIIPTDFVRKRGEQGESERRGDGMHSTKTSRPCSTILGAHSLYWLSYLKSVEKLSILHPNFNH